MTPRDRAQLFLLVRRQAVTMSILRTKLRKSAISPRQFDEGMARCDARIDNFLKEKIPCSNTLTL